MSIPLDKILLMDPSKHEELSKMKNPFAAWLKTKPNGITYDKFVNAKEQGKFTDRIGYSANMVFGSEHNFGHPHGNVENNVSSAANDLQNKKLLHLVISSPLIFFAFLTLCVLLLVLFERRRLVDEKDDEIEEFSSIQQNNEPILIAMASNLEIESELGEGKSSTSREYIAQATLKHIIAHLYHHKLHEKVVPCVAHNSEMQNAWE